MDLKFWLWVAEYVSELGHVHPLTIIIKLGEMRWLRITHD